MKISALTENVTPISTPNGNNPSSAPKFGRDPKVLEMSTTSGAIATEEPTNLGTHRRGTGALFKGIKTSKKFVNSPMTEDDISEEQLLNKTTRQEFFNKPKSSDISNKPTDREIMAKENDDQPLSKKDEYIKQAKELEIWLTNNNHDQYADSFGIWSNWNDKNKRYQKLLDLIKYETDKPTPKQDVVEQESIDENLHKWFKEKWVRFGPDGKIRGDCARGDDSEGKPKCLPQSKAHSLGKKGRASAAARKRREDPNPERSGKAINVNTKKKRNEGVAEGSLDEAVGGNYLYHATDSNGIKGMLQSGSIRAATAPQAATMAQTQVPTVSVTRDWGYASGANATNQMAGIGRDAIIVLDRSAIENNFKTLGTSQSTNIKGQAFNPYLKKDGVGRSQNTDPMARANAKAKAKYAEPTAKAGGEFEEVVVVPKGALPLKGTMVGFWVNPESHLMKDPTIMNDSRRLDMIRPNQFVRAKQTQGVAEGSRKAWLKHNDLVDIEKPLAGLKSEFDKLLQTHDPEEKRKYQQGIKQRIKTGPMAGPKGALPEQGVAEGSNPEYDDEAGMFKNDLQTIQRVSTHLEREIKDNENLPEWCQAKIAQAKGMIVNVMDYMISQHENGIVDTLEEEFNMIESIVESIAVRNNVDSEVIWEDLESLSDDELYVFAVTSKPINEDWQKANKRDKTDGMSQKAVNAYRRENPGSKLKTAVTTKPGKLKKGSKASKRRKSYCSRSKGQMNMHNISCSKTPDKAICKARRRWNC